MPRTIDATLYAAMTSGAFSPHMRAQYYRAGVKTAAQVLRYRLTGTELDITTDIFASDTYPAYIELERGAVINGTPSFITTSKFYIGERHYEFFNATNTVARVKATLFPQTRITLAGDDTYKNVITAFCTAFSKTAVFDDSTAGFWNYKMLPAGKQILLNNAMQFLNLLRQKYFIFACDQGSENVLFFAGMQDYHLSPDYTMWMDDSIDVVAGDIVTHNVFGVEYVPLDSRTYIARDENESIREGGTAGYPIQNLGYLEAAASFPALSQQKPLFQAAGAINLKPLDGDVVTVDPNYFGLVAHPIEVIEEFDPKRQRLNWSTTVQQIHCLENTAGGALPSTIERVSNYTPLNTGMFDGLLNRNHNNLQAAMDALDNYAAGWIDCLEGWTYVSAVSFTVVDDKTAKFRKGSRLRYTQGGAFQYAIVYSSAYNAGTNRTTVTVFTNADYSFSNGTIYNKGISYLNHPFGFPDWLNWTPTWTGFGAGAAPTNVGARFRVEGSTVFFALRGTTAGTSNATTMTVTTPSAAATGFTRFYAIAHTDNSINSVTPGHAELLSAGTVLNCYTNWAAGPWTNANGKTVRFVEGWYEF